MKTGEEQMVDVAGKEAVHYLLSLCKCRYQGEEAFSHRYMVMRVASARPEFLRVVDNQATEGWLVQVVEEQSVPGAQQCWWDLVVRAPSGEYRVVEERGVHTSLEKQRVVARDLLSLIERIEDGGVKFVLDRVLATVSVETAEDIVLFFSSIQNLCIFSRRGQPWLEYMLARLNIAMGNFKKVESYLDAASHRFRVVKCEAERKRLKRLVSQARAELRRYNYEEMCWLKEVRKSVKRKQPKMSTLPGPRNPFFTGREGLLKEIGEALFTKPDVPSPICVLTGLAGVGKTQIALEYLYRHLDDYDYVFWVNAQDCEHIIDAFESIAASISISKRYRANSLLFLHEIHLWMRQNGRWLLIIDGMDDDGIGEFMPKVFLGHILITTRLRHVHQPLCWEVKGLSPVEGGRLLLRRAGYLSGEVREEEEGMLIWDEDRERARALAEQVGGVPLALDQMGGWVQEQGQLLKDVLEQYERGKVDLLCRRGACSFGHAEAILPTLWEEIERLERCNLAAAALLKLCAVLAEAPVPFSLVLGGASLVVPGLREIHVNRAALGLVIIDLRAHHLGDRDPGEPAVTLPRLVRLAAVTGMSEEECMVWKRYAVLSVCQALEYIDQCTIPALYQAHAKACLRLILDGGVVLAEQEKAYSRLSKACS